MLNLAQIRRLYTDSGPYLALTEEQLVGLADGDKVSAAVTVSGGSTLAVICDLGARYALNSIEYFRNAATTENIAIFGRQGESLDYPWVELTVTNQGGSVSSSLDSLQDKYRQLKVIHTVTAGTSDVFELEVQTDGDNFQYGQEGEITKFSVDSGTNTLLPEEITIKNDTGTTQTYYVLTDGEDVDSLDLAIGPTSSGVFEALYESGLSFPVDFSWSSGEFTNTQEVDNKVVLVSGTYGVYHTPVLDVSALQGRRIFWKTTLSGSNTLDDSSLVDSLPTIGIRFSNTAPTDVGWSSGQVSNDSLWSLSSGTLSFSPYPNHTILDPTYYDYFQAEVEFNSPIHGQTPVLELLGIEEGLPITISNGSFNSFYVKSRIEEHLFGRQGSLIVWYFESRNEEQ